MRSAPLTTLVISFLLFATATFTTANEPPDSIAESGHMDHLASAEHFRRKATVAEETAADHYDLLRRYQEYGLVVVARHCKAIAEQYSDIAIRYQTMAQEHELLAKRE